MRSSLSRPVITLAVAASLLLALGGCGKEKRIKECAARCEAERQTCVHKRERDCDERARRCGEACAR